MANVYSKIPLNGFDGFTAEQLAEGLQKEFYRISRPETVADPKDVTKRLAGWITHPTTGELAIVLPDISIRKNSMADADGLINLLKSVISQDKQDKVVQDYQNNDSISIQELWEFLFPNETLNQAEMEAEGWFATEEEEEEEVQ